jgi:hypothetical protein
MNVPVLDFEQIEMLSNFSDYAADYQLTFEAIAKKLGVDFSEAGMEKLGKRNAGKFLRENERRCRKKCNTSPESEQLVRWKVAKCPAYQTTS